VTRITLVGCGNWGRYILRDLKALGSQVTVVARSGTSRAHAAQYGADHIVDSLAELQPDADGFVVATPTSLHAETVAALLEFQRPIFVEKPLTNDPRSARALAQRAGDRIFIMDKWRYHAGVQALRDIARAEEFGPLESIRTMRLGWASSHSDVDAPWILMPHDLAIVLEILGYIPDPVFAAADYTNSKLTGLLGVLGGTPKVVVEVSERRPETARSIALNFRDGAALLEDSYAGCIRVRRAVQADARKDDPLESRAIATEFPLLRELRAFLCYLEGGPPPKSSAPEGVRIVEVLAALRRLANAEAD
jgi:predicted dehydrogenase